jgi:hypothetical protein
MLEIIGLLVWFAAICWVSLMAFFTTVPTFSDALFSGVWHKKLLGVVIWCGVAYLWYTFFASFEINILVS